ncbi:MAG TPA: flagellar biosynthetic protein FliO [Sedimentisphaerales bacterium]|nr:flagellar biosynthetic protein FliO [Sedimentisphaerales bacterium]
MRTPFPHACARTLRPRHTICSIQETTAHHTRPARERSRVRRDDIEVHTEVNTNTKRIVALCILLIACGGWATLASRYGGQANRALPQTPAGFAAGTRSFLSDPNASGLTSTGLDNSDLFLRMALAIVVVGGLGGLALYLSKRVLPRAINPPGREIRIIETTYLGPRKALHLVEVGPRRLLLASTADTITMLAPLDGLSPEIAEQPVDDGREV